MGGNIIPITAVGGIVRDRLEHYSEADRLAQPMIEDGRVRARERESEIPARLCTPRISDMDLAMQKLYPNLNVPEETEITKEGESFKLCSGKHHALFL